jgi:hypothetical protein
MSTQENRAASASKSFLEVLLAFEPSQFSDARIRAPPAHRGLENSNPDALKVLHENPLSLSAGELG